MRKLCLLCLFIGFISYAQKSDFSHINFSRADNTAARLKGEKLKVNELAYALTSHLKTDVEKFRAIYIWITHNIANDHKLFLKNNKKRKKYFNDSVALDKWNSKFKKIVFKKLHKKKRTICSGYAYLLQEMCEVAGIKVKTIHGFGKTTDVDLENLLFANHSWSAVKLNKKWYLCDPTWSAGITSYEKKRFKFEYNDGYFLTAPKLFVMNHYPIEREWSLLNEHIPSFDEFSEAPLLYGDAFKYFTEHISPKKMNHTIAKNEIFKFEYKLKKSININKIKFVMVNGISEMTRKPKVLKKGNDLSLQLKFARRGFYDVHLYFDEDIIATYTLEVTK